MKIKFLQAQNGDSIHISFSDDENISRNILIDGGVSLTYENRKAKRKGDLFIVIEEIKNKGEFIDLLIVTHIDDDHIGGILKWLGSDLEANLFIKEIWFNSGKMIANHFKEKENDDLEIFIASPYDFDTGIKQGIKFEDYISQNGIKTGGLIIAGEEIQRFGAIFKILSPSYVKLEKLLKEWVKKVPLFETGGEKNDYNISLLEHVNRDVFKEDTSFPNGSSISFIFTYKNKNFLFLADGHPSVIVESLYGFDYSIEKKLNSELVKVSHHGSKFNNNEELLNLINSNKFIVTTNGAKHNHPDKQFLARLIENKLNCKIYFNYPELIELVFSEQDYKDYPNFEALPIETDFEF